VTEIVKKKEQKKKKKTKMMRVTGTTKVREPGTGSKS
jgi:hypothetical protein